jgi:hypothetical protein
MLRGLAIRAAGRDLPFQRGIYLFPSGVYDAREATLRVFRHPDLKVGESDGLTVQIQASGREFTFDFPDAATAAQARSVLVEGGRHLEAGGPDSRREQARLDPLIDSGFSSPFSPQVRLVRSDPFWSRFALVVAVGAGAALGPAIWKTRNILSERSLYAHAVAANDIPGYRAYLASGGSRPEVSSVLLPRAELEVAVRAGTVEALEKYADAHPASAIQAEVDAALRAAVGAEFTRAKDAGTVSALDALARQRKTYEFVLPAIEAARTALFRDALKRFNVGKTPEVASFFERLVGFLKEHGPEVSVRIVRRTPESTAAADAQVKQSAYYMGKQSIPSQYFVGDYAEAREKALLERILPPLAAPFSSEMLVFRPIAVHTEPGDPPELAVPVLTIESVPEMSGGYMSSKPRGVFVGLGMLFKARFSIPGDTKPLDYKFSVWRTPNPQILKNDGATVADVYEKMAGDAIERFGKGFLEYMLGVP